MIDTEKVKAVEYLIHNVYMVEHNKLLGEFLLKYAENVRQSTVLSMQIGMPVSMKPLTLDLRIPTEELVKSLAMFEVLHKKDDKPQ